jgi:hypothetical protein
MNRIPLSLTVLGTLLAIAVQTAPANAQATRTWVSGVGDDVNPCSRTAPCKTFAGAISKTAAGGEINCLDPAGYGAVTITKSMAIVCDHTLGGILSAGTNGVIINTPGTDKVFLSGLDINGAGTGINGIRMIQAGVLHVRNSIIRNVTTNGIDFANTAFAELYVTNTAISEVGAAGILVRPTGNTVANAVINGASLHNNANGLKADGGAASGAASGVRVVLRNSTASGNTTNGVEVTSTAGFAPTVLISENNTMSGNTNGLSVSGTTGFAVISNSTISRNGTGVVLASSGSLVSYKNNMLNSNNTSDGAAPTSFFVPN